ncbi:MAG TPA: YggT family protein [Candidatus Paceibacterota bacterium]
MDNFYSLRTRVTQLTVRIVDVVIGLIEGLLVLRFVLQLLGANPYSGFSQWVYATSNPLMQPFANIFSSWHLGADYVIDFSTLFAIVVYALAGWLISRLLSFAASPH